MSTWMMLIYLCIYIYLSISYLLFKIFILFIVLVVTGFTISDFYSIYTSNPILVKKVTIWSLHIDYYFLSRLKLQTYYFSLLRLRNPRGSQVQTTQPNFNYFFLFSSYFFANSHFQIAFLHNNLLSIAFDPHFWDTEVPQTKWKLILINNKQSCSFAVKGSKNPEVCLGDTDLFK